jgi:hypothetical protein
MTSPWESQQGVWEEVIAERLRNDGYVVTIEPGPDSLPFSLGGYHPDLVASRDDEGLIIELKRTEQKVPIDRYVAAAAIVRQHPGWRFLLIPTERIEETGLTPLLQLPRLADLVSQLEGSSILLEQRLRGAAFITAWVGIEGALRVIAELNDVPLSALSPTSLILHSRSQGLVSQGQFAALQRLVVVRNSVVHGFAEPDAAELAPLAVDLLRDLLAAVPSRPAI